MIEGNGQPGRNSDGQFAPGNKIGGGNPRLRALGKFKKAIAEVLDDETAIDLVRQLIAMARDKTLPAGVRLDCIRELWDRSEGRSMPSDLMADIEEFREQIEEMKARSIRG